MHECKQETSIDMIRDDLKEIKSDIKEVLAFKYKWLGVMSVISGIVMISVTIASRVLAK